MKFKNLDELFEKCWDKWGEKAQTDMLIEEGCELIHAVMKYKRNSGSLEHVAEELGDVILVGMQFIHAMGLEKTLDESLDKKIERLKRRIGSTIDQGE